MLHQVSGDSKKCMADRRKNVPFHIVGEGWQDRYNVALFSRRTSSRRRPKRVRRTSEPDAGVSEVDSLAIGSTDGGVEGEPSIVASLNAGETVPVPTLPTVEMPTVQMVTPKVILASF